MRVIKIFVYLPIVLLGIASSAWADATIQAKVEQSEWQTKSAIYAKEHQSVFLKVKAETKAQIRWYQIVPNTSKHYKNANHPWEPNPYKWAGFGKIEYRKIELKQFKDLAEIELTAELLKRGNLWQSPYYAAHLGSFWFQVVITDAKGNKISSPGLESKNDRGLSPKTFRVSYMKDGSYIGYLTSFFNVPGVFGSIPYQSQNYIGVDCADVLMAANAIKNKTQVRDLNVAWLVTNLKHVAKKQSFIGAKTKFRWGKDIFPGDFIAVRYLKNRQYAHIGALYEDKNNDGYLDGGDLVIHAGPNALSFATVLDAGFIGDIVVLKNGERS
jgi:hypothetical protein